MLDDFTEYQLIQLKKLTDSIPKDLECKVKDPEAYKCIRMARIWSYIDKLLQIGPFTTREIAKIFDCTEAQVDFILHVVHAGAFQEAETKDGTKYLKLATKKTETLNGQTSTRSFDQSKENAADKNIFDTDGIMNDLKNQIKYREKRISELE